MVVRRETHECESVQIKLIVLLLAAGSHAQAQHHHHEQQPSTPTELLEGPGNHIHPPGCASPAATRRPARTIHDVVMMDDFIYGEPQAIQYELELTVELINESGAHVE